MPLIKGYSSERAYGLLNMSLQCFGGSGFTQDWPIEQYIRDQKIDTLYEGTTHIQSLDLFFRKVARDGGATLQGLLGRIRETAEGDEGGAVLASERASLGVALGDVEAIFMTMLGKAQESVHHVGMQGNRVLLSLAELVVGWLLVRHAAVALRLRDGASEADALFYDGKVASAARILLGPIVVLGPLAASSAEAPPTTIVAIRGKRAPPAQAPRRPLVLSLSLSPSRRSHL